MPGDLRRQGKGDAPVGGLLQVQTGMASATLGANGCAASQDSLRAGCSPKKKKRGALTTHDLEAAPAKM